MNPLERRGRRLLLAYPAAYRAERGDEILDTLLESAPGRRLGRREAWALLTGGLRVRAEQHRRLPTATNLRLGALYGVALWFATTALPALWNVAVPRQESSTYIGGRFESSTVTWPYPSTGRLVFELVTIGATVALAVVAWFPRPRIVAALAVVSAAGSLPWRWPGSPLWLFTAGLLVLLARGEARMPRAWLGPLALFAIGWTAREAWFVPNPGATSAVLIWAALAAIVLWTIFDGRPLFGVGVMLVIIFGFDVVALARHGGSFLSDWTAFLPLAIGFGLLIPGLLRVRRQAVL
jgi:hypothetical protein